MITGPITSPITTVTPNPALDVSYRVAALRPGHTHRVTAVHARAGGKGLNVTRVLHQLGVPSTAVGPVGGPHGDAVRADLTAAGIAHLLLPVSAPTRLTVTVLAPPEATVLAEPGGPLTAADWDRLCRAVAEQPTAVLVCSGSLPRGAPGHGYADLVRIARSRAIPVLVDAGGPALLAAARAGADLLKPNADELAAATGSIDPLAGARRLLAEGAAAVVVSLGERGLLAVTAAGNWSARPPHPVSGNPTGAGDAAVAALAHGMALRTGWPDRLRTAVAWSAAAVAAPLAGTVDEAVLADVLPAVAIRPGGPE